MFLAFAAVSKSDDAPLGHAEALANEALQKSNLGRYAEADSLFAKAGEQIGTDAIVARRLRNYRAIHDLNQAARFTDRVVFLQDGVVIAEGRPADVYSPELIKRVYGVEVELSLHKGFVQVHPLSERDQSALGLHSTPPEPTHEVRTVEQRGYATA
mgnify:CR=1 FL=1